MVIGIGGADANESSQNAEVMRLRGGCPGTYL